MMGQGRDMQILEGVVEAYAVQEGADWLVITVITRYF